MVKRRIALALGAMLLSSCATSGGFFSSLLGGDSEEEASEAESQKHPKQKPSEEKKTIYIKSSDQPITPLQTGGNSTDSASLAKLHGAVVTQQKMEQQLGALGAEQKRALTPGSLPFRQLLVKTAIREHLLSKAMEDKLDRDPQLVQLMRQAKEQVLIDRWLQRASMPAADYPADEQVVAAYQENQKRFTVPARVNLSQIYVAKKGGDEKALRQARSTIEKVAEALKREPESFSELAKKHSDHKQSAVSGGVLGWQQVDQINPAILKAIGGLKQGEVSTVIEQKGGFHLLRIEAIQPVKLRPIKEVRPVLVQSLRLRRLNENRQQLLKQLADAVEVSEAVR